MTPLDTSWLLGPKLPLRPLDQARPPDAEDDYLAFCRFVLELTGIDLSQYRRGYMERRLRSLYAPRGIRRLTDVCGELRRDPGRRDQLLDRITSHTAQLWRNPAQWELIRGELLPSLAASAERGRLRIWSAGCSGGAEAYTLATLAGLGCPELRVRVHGTDVDHRMIARARLGLFDAAAADGAPTDLLRAGFDPVDGGWRAKLGLRAITRFDVGDLLRISPRPAGWDLILCRNTAGYFTGPIRDELHRRLAEGLRAGGQLVLGVTESVADPAALGLEPVAPSVYRHG